MRILILLLIVNIITGVAAATELADFKELRSDHFSINYQEGVVQDYVYKIKEVAEKYYRIITQEFNLIRDQLWLWDNRARVFIAKDKENYLSRFSCSSWSGACVDYRAKIIYTYPDQSSFRSIFIHELAHIILHEYVGTSRLDSWLDEGIAVYIEDKYGGGFYQGKIPWLVKLIKSNQHIPITDLFAVTALSLEGKSSDYAGLFYVESFSLINFFVKTYGQHNFSRFLSHLKYGDSLNKALAKSFRDCQDPGELEKQWRKFYLK